MARPREMGAIQEIKRLEPGLGFGRPVEKKGAFLARPKPVPGCETAVPAGPRNGGNIEKKAVTFRRGAYLKPESAATAFELRELASAVRRIHDPMRSNPEAILAAKDGIAARLVRLADAMEAAHG